MDLLAIALTIMLDAPMPQVNSCNIGPAGGDRSRGAETTTGRASRSRLEWFAVFAVAVAMFSAACVDAVSATATSTFPEWSNSATDVAPLGGGRFRASSPTETATLTLFALPAHANISVSFHPVERRR